MNKLVTLLIINLLFVNLVVAQQHAWQNDNVIGHSIDPYTNKIDTTEGFGAFDSVIATFDKIGPKNIDNGGGKYDNNSEYIKIKYNVDNLVYDPFMRPEEHNKEVLNSVSSQKRDTCTSFSVLNVIDSREARLKHIKLCFDAIKEDGQAFFKVWPGNSTGIQQYQPGSYQSNQNIYHYVKDIAEIFGFENICIDIESSTIKAIKKSGFKKIAEIGEIKKCQKGSAA